MKRIELNDEQVNELVNFYEAKIGTLHKERFEIEAEIYKHKKMIAKLKGEDSPLVKKMSRTKVTWRQAAKLVLEEENELLPTSEILEKIEIKYPSLTEGKERRSTISSLSGTLSMAIDKEQLSRFEKPEENYYGLNEWFEDGFPKEEYLNKINKRGYNFDLLLF